VPPLYNRSSEYVSTADDGTKQMARLTVDTVRAPRTTTWCSDSLYKKKTFSLGCFHPLYRKKEKMYPHRV
jgi:hypothetical protein